MANGGYTGALPARDDSPEAYSGVWESQEQYAELAAGRWAQQATGLAPRSVRLNSADSAYFSRTPGTAGNRRVWTWSGWVKKCNVSSQQTLWSAGSTGTNRSNLLFQGTGELRFFNYAGSVDVNLITTPVFRDPSAWYHILAVADTTQSTAANRFKLFINGSQITAFSTATYPSQSQDLVINSAIAHGIGRGEQSGGEYIDALVANIYFIDGQALEPEAFGFFDGAGVWQPRPYRGTYGTNGFYLDFSNNSAATATALGADRSGNQNNWSPTNFAVAPAAWYKDANFAVGTQTGGTDLPATAMFDGNLASAWGAGRGPGTLKWVLTNAVSIPAGTLEVNAFGGPGDYQGYWYVTVKNAAGTTLTSQNITSNTAAWYSLGSGLGNIKEIWLTFDGGWNPGAAYAGGAIHEFRIGSQVLVWNDNFSFNDSLLDSPVNGRQSDTGLGGQVQGNYATWNPLISTTNLTNGNLSVVQPGTSAASRYSTIGMSSGKWYWEITVVKYANTVFGIRTPGGGTLETPYDSTGYGMGWRTSGGFFIGGSNTGSGSLSLAAGDVLGLGFDAGAGTLAFYKNGSLVHTLTANASYIGQTWFAGSQDSVAGNSDHDVNFGQRPFAYQSPGTNRPSADYKALCTANLPEPAIKRGDDYFQTLLYTGNGSTQTLRGLRFSPDLVWQKPRSNANPHQLFDRVRGDNARLKPSATDSEYIYSAGVGLSFDSSGFTVGTDNGLNESGQTFVAWTWDAGTSTVTLNPGDPGAGSIASQVRVNPIAGFSIIDFSATNGTVGHGLGVAPEFFIYKARTTASNWSVYHKSLGNTKRLLLNTTDAEGTSSIFWNNTSPTSSVITLGSNFSGVGSSIIYAFAPVAGYSSAFSYTGNGDSSGPFVHLGFRPRFIIQKRTDSAGSWLLIDTARDPVNVARNEMFANSSAAEYDNGSLLDVLSNGFKIRATFANMNASGGSYIGFAFAESPFQYARAR